MDMFSLLNHHERDEFAIIDDIEAGKQVGEFREIISRRTDQLDEPIIDKDIEIEKERQKKQFDDVSTVKEEITPTNRERDESIKEILSKLTKCEIASFPIVLSSLALLLQPIPPTSFSPLSLLHP